MMTGSVVLGDTTGLSGTATGSSGFPRSSRVTGSSGGSKFHLPPSFSRILMLRTYTVLAFPSSRVAIT